MQSVDLKPLESISPPLTQKERLLLEFLKQATWEESAFSNHCTVKVPHEYKGIMLVQSWSNVYNSMFGGIDGELAPFIRRLNKAGIITMDEPYPVKPDTLCATTGSLTLPRCDVENLAITAQKSRRSPG